MGKDLKNYPCGGNTPVHFYEDGAFNAKPVPTTASAAVSDVFDLGETLTGITIRAYADEAVTATAGSMVLEIYAGNDAKAASTSTAWKNVAKVVGTGTAMFAAGDKILEYIPADGDGKYYFAKLSGGTGFTGGKVSVWNEMNGN